MNAPDDGEAQRAFVALLTRPLLTPDSDPDQHRLVTRHAKSVQSAATRLGYRVTTVGRAVRLIRTPLAATVAHPTQPQPAPTRRTLAMTCVVAAACEEHGGPVTLARLSDSVAQLTATPTSPVPAYDPALLSHRRDLLRAVAELEHWGALTRRTANDALIEAWATAGEGIGAGYHVDRDALLLLTDPQTVAATLNPDPADTEQLSATRTIRALRTLIETPSVVYTDMDPTDADTLRTTRGLRASEVIALVGGHVEARTEGLVLLLPDEPPTPATVNWPRAATVSWVGLLLADTAGRYGTRSPGGTVHLDAATVDDLAEDLRTWKGTYLSKDLRDDAAKVRAAAEGELRHLGLLRTTDTGTWILSPVAGRYRDPDIQHTDTTRPPPEQENP